MLSPRSCSMNVHTAKREYDLDWYPSGKDPGIVVHVVTRLGDKGKGGERFFIPQEEIARPIRGIQDLEAWFYEDFAYQYADLHESADGSSCTRASILYDIGNYFIQSKEDAEPNISSCTFTIFDNETVQDDEIPIFYVSMDSEDACIYCFGSYENAEQWANEKLYQDDTINVTGNNKPYTIFTVKKTDKANGCDSCPSKNPKKEEKKEELKKENCQEKKACKEKINSVYKAFCDEETLEKTLKNILQEELKDLLK